MPGQEDLRMQVKLFWKKNPGVGPYGKSNENGIAMESEINAWLRENPNIKVVDIKQSASGGSWGPMLWSVSIWYEESIAP